MDEKKVFSFSRFGQIHSTPGKRTQAGESAPQQLCDPAAFILASFVHIIRSTLRCAIFILVNGIISGDLERHSKRDDTRFPVFLSLNALVLEIFDGVLQGDFLEFAGLVEILVLVAVDSGAMHV